MEMSKITCSLLCLLILAGCVNHESCESADSAQATKIADSLAHALDWPHELAITYFAGPDVTPSPACLAVAATGEVFVGVDMIGSLGKDPGRGAIVRLVDCNHDGVADTHAEFAKVDNPRGIIPLGNRVFVLHTAFSKETGKASGMDLVVFEDANNDGVADGSSKPLIQNISNEKFLQSRGTDHATNGIRLGIDGWIYIAVGDFGFHDAVDRSGKKLTMLGGGIVRVRPDGTEMEVYTHGTRNIYDVAIDPYMNIFTRGNTNDGGGWNIRFSHHVQSGEYGYPVLFKHFTNEIIPALVDVGGGSGTGALFLDDPSWPANLDHVPMMADWGRSELFIHRVTPDSASFTQMQEDFLKLPQITDLDIDGSGRLYLSAWDGAGFKGDSAKGFVIRAVPTGWQYHPFPDIKDASTDELSSLLTSAGAVTRLEAQQELLLRPAGEASEAAWKIAADKNLSLDKRVAGIFTYAQIAGKNGISNLVKLTAQDEVREFALRALADRLAFVKEVPIEPFLTALKDPSPRVRVAAEVGLGRLGRIEAAEALLKTRVPFTFKAPESGTEGPHASPNASIVPAHIAVRTLVKLNAVDACINAVGSVNSTIALWALSYMHDSRAVEGLIDSYNKARDPSLKKEIITTLSRLYKKEAPYDGSTWWSTRPDTRGPYYNAVEWEGSASIKDFLVKEWRRTNAAGKKLFADLNGKDRMGIGMFGGEEAAGIAENDKVDLNKIRAKKGAIGSHSIEDVMLALDDIKGDPALGKGLFKRQGCVACHSISKGEVLKGPFMGQIGSIMTRHQIAESILKPDASISQGFASVHVTTKDKKDYVGFITQESADKLVMRNTSGEVFTVKAENILTRKELETSMMPTGLANSLSYEEFASLVTFLSQQKK
jgi:putative heme-binding domain-containing protein